MSPSVRAGGPAVPFDLGMGLLLALVVVGPVALWPGLFVVFSLAKLAVLQVVVAAVLLYLGLFAGRNQLLPPFGLDYVFFLLIVASSVAAIFSSGGAVPIFGQYGRYEGLITYACYFFIFIFAARMDWTADRLRVILGGVAVGACLVSLMGVLQWLGVDPIVWPEIKFEAGRVFSTFGNPSFLATFLAAALPICAALAGESNVRWRIFGILTLALAAGILMVTFTRGGWIAGLLGMAVFFMLRWGRERVAVIGVACLVVVVLIIAGAGLSPGSELSRAVTERRGSVWERVEVWRVGARAAASRPLLGYGPDNFRVAFSPRDTQARAATAGGRELIDNAHNYPIQLGATVGLPAAGIFFSWLAWLLVSSLSRAGSGDEARYTHAIVSAVIASLTGLLFTINTIGSAVVMWVLLGALRGRVAPATGTGDRKKFFLPVGVVLAAGLLALTATQLIADLAYADAKRASQAGESQQALGWFARAVEMNPWVVKYREDYGLLALDKAIYTNDPADFESAVLIFRGARDIAPKSSDASMLLGQAYLYYGRAHEPEHLAEAREHLERAVDLWPQGASGRYLLGETYLALGDTRKAIGFLESALRIRSDFREASEALRIARTRLREGGEAVPVRMKGSNSALD